MTTSDAPGCLTSNRTEIELSPHIEAYGNLVLLPVFQRLHAQRRKKRLTSQQGWRKLDSIILYFKMGTVFLAEDERPIIESSAVRRHIGGRSQAK